MSEEREVLDFKIVYDGSGYVGKSTSLQHVCEALDRSETGPELFCLDEREQGIQILYSSVAAPYDKYLCRFWLTTAPGPIYAETSRDTVYDKIDGLIFVADSERVRMEANEEALVTAKQYLAKHKGEREIPIVFQYNKQDLPVRQRSTRQELEEMLNPQGRHASFLTSASQGEGVLEAFKRCAMEVLKSYGAEVQGVAPLELSDMLSEADVGASLTESVSASGLVLRAEERQLKIAYLGSPMRWGSHAFTRLYQSLEAEECSPCQIEKGSLGGDLWSFSFRVQIAEESGASLECCLRALSEPAVDPEIRKNWLLGVDGVIFVTEAYPEFAEDAKAALAKLTSTLRWFLGDEGPLPVAIHYVHYGKEAQNGEELGAGLSVEAFDVLVNPEGYSFVTSAGIPPSAALQSFQACFRAVLGRW